MSEHKGLYCDGQLEQQLVTRLQQHQGRWVIIENVPALVCQQCGERFYTPQAHDLVVSLISRHQSPVRTEIVQVYGAKSVA